MRKTKVSVRDLTGWWIWPDSRLWWEGTRSLAQKMTSFHQSETFLCFKVRIRVSIKVGLYRTRPRTRFAALV